MGEHQDETMWEVMAVLVTAMTTTLDKLDKIAERVADVAVFTEAIYAENLREIREREGIGNGGT